MPADWAEKLNARLEKDKTKSAQSVSAFVQKSGKQIKVITAKLQRLLDGYLEQDIDREIYRTEKAKLLSGKKSLEEQNTKLEQKQNDWLEPMAEWIKVASNLEKTARDSNLLYKKVAAEQVFGSNLVLANREARLCAPSGEDLSRENQWAALRAAHQFVGQKSESLILERERGIEPPSLAWEASVLPLYYSRVLCIERRSHPRVISSQFQEACLRSQRIPENVYCADEEE